MHQSSSGRSRQPPRAGPSLASPVPSSLRPSAFRPRASFAPTSQLGSPAGYAGTGYSPELQTPTTAQRPRAPHPTPATATPGGAGALRRPNPFDVLPSASFDSFVDDITTKIRSALAGPPKPERRVAVEQSPGVTSSEEDVFGEVKALADAAPTANGTNGHSEDQSEYDDDESELDRPALASADDEQSGSESDAQLSAAGAQHELPELDPRRAPPAMPAYGSDSSSDADGDGDASELAEDAEMDYQSNEDELEPDQAPLSFDEQIAAFGWDEPVAGEWQQVEYEDPAPPSPSPPPPAAAAIEVLELGSDSDDDDPQPEPFAAHASDSDIDVEDAASEEFGDEWFDDGEREGEEGEMDLPVELRRESPSQDESPMREDFDDAPEYEDEDEDDPERRALHAPSRSASPDNALAAGAPPLAESDAESVLGSRIPWSEKGKGRAPTPPSPSSSSSSDTDSQYESELDSDMEPDPANIMDLSFDRLAKMLEENNELRTSALANGRDSRVRQLEHNYGIIQAIYQHKEDQGEIDGSETGEEDGSRENNGSGDDDDGDGAFSETDEDKAARLDAAERISEIAEHLVSMESRGEHRPLEIANHFEHQPAPPPPPAAEDHIPFELSDDEASSDVHDSESEALLLGLASGTGPSVFGAPLSPEPDEPEVVVLDDSDDDDLPRNGERDSERESSSDNMMVDEDATLEAQRRSESSEPMSYADSDSREQSYEPATIKNVLAPGYWDPSTPLRFGAPAASPGPQPDPPVDCDPEVEPVEASADSPRESDLDVEMSLEVDAEETGRSPAADDFAPLEPDEAHTPPAPDLAIHVDDVEDPSAPPRATSCSSTPEPAQATVVEPEDAVAQGSPSIKTDSLLPPVVSAPELEPEATAAPALGRTKPEGRVELETVPPTASIASPVAESLASLEGAPDGDAAVPSAVAPAPVTTALPSPSPSPKPFQQEFEALDGAPLDSFFKVDPEPALEASDDLAALVRTLQAYVEPAFVPPTASNSLDSSVTLTDVVVRVQDSLEASSEALELLVTATATAPDSSEDQLVPRSRPDLDVPPSEAVVDELERVLQASSPRAELDAAPARVIDPHEQGLDAPAHEIEERFPAAEAALPSLPASGATADDEPTPSDGGSASPPSHALAEDGIDGEAVPDEDRASAESLKPTFVETELAQADTATEEEDSEGDTTTQSEDLVITAASPHIDEMDVDDANSGSEPTAAGDELASPIDAPPSPPSALAARPESVEPISATDLESSAPEAPEPHVDADAAMDLELPEGLSAFLSTAGGKAVIEPSREEPSAEPEAPEVDQQSREATPTVDEPAPVLPAVVVEPFDELADAAVEPQPSHANAGRGHRRSRSGQSFTDENDGSEDELTLVPTALRKPARRRKVALDSGASDPTRRHSPRLSIGQPEATSPRRRTCVPLPSELSQSFTPAEPGPDEDDAGSQAQAPDERSVRGVSEASSSGGTGRKRPRASVVPAPANEPEPLLKAEASQPAKRRRGRPSKNAPAVEDEPLSAPPAHHHQRRAPAVAPVATDGPDIARPAADIGPPPDASSLHPPVTRSNCQYVVIELCSKEAPASAPYTIVLPACALAAPLAQETMDDFTGRLLGPATDCDIHDADVVRLGGSGLEEGDADDADALIEDGDVRVAIKRILGNDLYAEGVCELVRRGSRGEGDEGGVKVVSPQRKRRRD